MTTMTIEANATIPNDIDCEACGAVAELLTCSGCGVSAYIVDCGDMPQPRPLAAGGAMGEVFCDGCYDESDDADDIPDELACQYPRGDRHERGENPVTVQVHAGFNASTYCGPLVLCRECYEVNPEGWDGDDEDGYNDPDFYCFGCRNTGRNG